MGNWYSFIKNEITLWKKCILLNNVKICFLLNTVEYLYFYFLCIYRFVY